MAAKTGNWLDCNYLIQFEGDIVGHADQETALMKAASAGHQMCVKRLLF